MTGVHTDDLYSAHLKQVLRTIEHAMQVQQVEALIIHAGDSRLAFQDDQSYPFRPNPWFQWLAPVPSAPGSLFLIRNNKRPSLIIVTPDDYWHTPPSLPRAPWTQHFDLAAVADPASALARLAEVKEPAAWLGEPAPPDSAWQLNPPRLIAHLQQARCIKTPYEIDCMREATRIGVHGHRAAEAAFRAGSSEFDIHMAFLAATRQNEAELPYGSIVALNEHGATLHYQLRDTTPPTPLRSLLIDAGASAAGYASDITRTWAAGDDDFAALVQGMDGLQQQLCAQVQAGADWRELHLEAHRLVAGLLRDAGVLRIGAEEAVARGVSSAFLPHGLGHLLGLQVHDVGGLRPDPDSEPIPRPEGHPALRLTRRLQAGMVVTVEPGLYFIDSLLRRLRDGPHGGSVDWSRVDALKDCGGIRIEDNVLVQEGARENLTRAAFAAA